MTQGLRAQRGTGDPLRELRTEEREAAIRSSADETGRAVGPADALLSPIIDEKRFSAMKELPTSGGAAPVRVDAQLALRKVLTPELREKILPGSARRRVPRGTFEQRGRPRSAAGDVRGALTTPRPTCGGQPRRNASCDSSSLAPICSLAVRGRSRRATGLLRVDDREAVEACQRRRARGLRSAGRALPAGRLPALLSLREQPSRRERHGAGGVPEGFRRSGSSAATARSRPGSIASR